MKKLLLALCLCATPAAAQNYYVQRSPFWDNYYAGLGGPNNLGAVLAQQRNTEAIVNAIRASRGQLPCSIGLIGQWQGRPAC